MDKIDRKILNILQENCRLPVASIAKEIAKIAENQTVMVMCHR